MEKWVDPKSGQSTGRVKHPDSLPRAVQTLVNRTKVNAVAVVGCFSDDDVEDMDDYRQGMVWKLYSWVPCCITVTILDIKNKYLLHDSC